MRRDAGRAAPDWRTLQIFVAAVEMGSLTQAAQEVGIAVSAATKRIQMLEAQYGVRLLERRARGVRPSAAGAALLHRARALLDLSVRLTDDMHVFAAGGSGSTRLHATTSAIVGHGLAGILASFEITNPRIQVEMREATSAAVLRDLSDGRADLGIVTSGSEVPAACEAHPWREDRVLVLMRKDHPLARRRSLDFATVLEHPFIDAGEGGALSTLLAREARRLGRELRYRFRVANTDARRSLVAAGFGLGVIPEGMLRPGEAHLGLCGIPLAEPWAQRRLHVVTSRAREMAAQSRLLLQHLLKETNIETARRAFASREGSFAE